MNVKITITADTGEVAEDIIEVSKKGDAEEAINIVMSAFRIRYPEVPPFNKTIRIALA
jgi:hypothetical protein